MTVDLDLLARELPDADHGAQAAVRSQLQRSGLAARYGRVAELAAWWAGVHPGPVPPEGPRVVRLLGAADPGPDRLPDDLDVAAACTWAIGAVDRAVDGGADLLVLAVEPDAAASVAVADALGLDPVEVSGWPLDQGRTDEEWMAAVAGLRDALHRLRALGTGPGPGLVTRLETYGSPALAAATAALVAAAARRTPLLLDGAGAAVAALLARGAGYASTQWWQVAHAPATAPCPTVIENLQATPLLTLGLTGDDGTGARLALPVVAEALRLAATAAVEGDAHGG